MSAGTVLAELIGALDRVLVHDPNVMEAPRVILWTDNDRSWESVIDRVAEMRPVVKLGELDVDQVRGPAYWVRCVVEGATDGGLAPGTPVVYIPGFSRDDLRAVEACPEAIAPIAHWQYRGQWFTHPNGRDWTILGLLSNQDRGLGLEVAEDEATLSGLRHALPKLLDEPVARLRGQRIDSQFLAELLDPDPAQSLLDFIDDPAGFRSRSDDGRLAAFSEQCKAAYRFDPADGELAAARQLGRAQGAWVEVWRRYRVRPDAYPNIGLRLRQARPGELLPERPQAWPQDNEQAEEQVRKALVGLASATEAEARAQIAALESEHGCRRGWVWADLGEAPLAFAMEKLAQLAEITSRRVTGADVAELTQAYFEWAWTADEAAIDALASVAEAHDRDAVSAALDAVYRPWLDDSARALQAAVGPAANAQTYAASAPPQLVDGTVVVFVDGMRMDVAQRLGRRLRSAGLKVALEAGLAALPTVTQTSKPTLLPVPPGDLKDGPGLYAARAGSGAKADVNVLRSVLSSHGVEPVAQGANGDPQGRAWVEIGDIDHLGHDRGVGLVYALGGEVEAVARRIRDLLEAGWNEVRVVTDHGWILLPGQLAKVDLPIGAVEVRKGRCARVKEGGTVAVGTVPWHWNPDVRIAIAPGAMCFEAGKEYEHGGISLQECVVPRLTVALGAAQTATGGPEITMAKWLGLMCRIEYAGIAPGATIDVRLAAGDSGTSVLSDRPTTVAFGKSAAFVEDEDLEGRQAAVVIVDEEGLILAQKAVTIGENR